MKTQCPLCGSRFDTEDNESCRACPGFKKCGMVQCPHCGHEFPGS